MGARDAIAEWQKLQADASDELSAAMEKLSAALFIAGKIEPRLGGVGRQGLRAARDMEVLIRSARTYANESCECIELEREQ